MEEAEGIYNELKPGIIDWKPSEKARRMTKTETRRKQVTWVEWLPFKIQRIERPFDGFLRITVCTDGIEYSVFCVDDIGLCKSLKGVERLVGWPLLPTYMRVKF